MRALRRDVLVCWNAAADDSAARDGLRAFELSEVLLLGLVLLRVRVLSCRSGLVRQRHRHRGLYERERRGGEQGQRRVSVRTLSARRCVGGGGRGEGCCGDSRGAAAAERW